MQTCDEHPILKRRENICCSPAFIWWFVVTLGSCTVLSVICLVEDLFKDEGAYYETKEGAVDIFLIVLFSSVCLVLAEGCRHIWFRQDGNADRHADDTRESWRKIQRLTDDGSWQPTESNSLRFSDVRCSFGNFIALGTLFGVAAQFIYFQLSISAQWKGASSDPIQQHEDLDSHFWPPIAVTIHDTLQRFFVGLEFLHDIPFVVQFWASVGLVWFWLLLCSWVASREEAAEALGSNHMLIYTHKLMLGLFFIPIMRILVHGVSCRRVDGDEDGNGKLVVNSARSIENGEETIECWGQHHLGIAICSILTAEYFATFGLFAKCLPALKKAVQGSSKIDVVYAPRYEVVQIFFCLVVAVTGTLEVGSPLVSSSVACICAALIWLCVLVSTPCLVSHVNTLIGSVFGVMLCITASFVLSLAFGWKRDLRQIAVMAIFASGSVLVWVLSSCISRREPEDRRRHIIWIVLRVLAAITLAGLAVFIFMGNFHDMCQQKTVYGTPCPDGWGCNTQDTRCRATIRAQRTVGLRSANMRTRSVTLLWLASAVAACLALWKQETARAFRTVRTTDRVKGRARAMATVGVTARVI